MLKAEAEPKTPTCLTPLAVATEENQAGRPQAKSSTDVACLEQVKMVEFLLKHGADPHARAKGGWRQVCMPMTERIEEPCQAYILLS